MSAPRPSQLFQGRECLDKETLRQYLAGTLPAGVRWSVENHLLDCPLCTAAVAGLSAAPPDIDTLAFPPFQPPPARQGLFAVARLRLRRWTAAAAVLLLLAVLLSELFLPASPPLPEELFREYYTSYPCDVPLSYRGDTASPGLQEALREGLSSYTAGDYHQAARHLGRFLALQPNHASANFFNGMAYLESGQALPAVPYLQAAASLPGIYRDQACWYLSLAYLRVGDLPAAAAMLDSLQAGGDTFLAGRARALRAYL